MQINSHVIREDKHGQLSEFYIATQAHLEYHKSLEEEGFKYTVKPVIHNNLEPCESCSA